MLPQNRFLKNHIFVKSLVVSLVITFFPGLFLVNVNSANAVGTTTLRNSVVMINPITNLSESAGLIGDVLTFSLNESTNSATVKFSGSNAVSATWISTVSGVSNFSVVVPAGTTTGPVTVTTAANTYDAGTFQLWASRGEPYVMPNGHLNVTLDDLKFILDQIKIAEAHSARTATSLANLKLGSPSGNLVYPYDATSQNRCLISQDITSASTTAFGPTALSNQYVWTAEDPWGLRQVEIGRAHV